MNHRAGAGVACQQAAVPPTSTWRVWLSCSRWDENRNTSHVLVCLFHFEVISRVCIRGLKVSGKLLVFWFFIEVSVVSAPHQPVNQMILRFCFCCFLDWLMLLTLHISNIFSLHLARGDTKEDVASPRQLTEEMPSFKTDSWPWSSLQLRDTISCQYLTNMSNCLTV